MIQHAEDLMRLYDDDSAARAALDDIPDENLKAFLKLELNLKWTPNRVLWFDKLFSTVYYGNQKQGKYNCYLFEVLGIYMYFIVPIRYTQKLNIANS